MCRFLLTRPLRDVTAVRPLSPKTAPISTHTPLAGRDARGCGYLYVVAIFLLTRPLRDVTSQLVGRTIFTEFLLTRPLRDVTVVGIIGKGNEIFLLTRPLRDVTYTSLGTALAFNLFLLTRPLRDVTRFISSDYKTKFISTHTPLAGRDPTETQLVSAGYISTHTPLAGRD